MIPEKEGTVRSIMDFFKLNQQQLSNTQPMHRIYKMVQQL